MSAVVLFDGHCSLCNAGVRFILQRDRGGVFRFAAQQSEAGQKLLADHQCPAGRESIVVLAGGVAYRESDAVLQIARRLGWPWRGAWALRHLPRSWRDAVYRFVARHRYRWFRPLQQCPLPPTEWRARFLDSPPH